MNEHRRHEFVAVSVCFTLLALLGLVARLVSRRMKKLSLALDDYLLVVSCIFCVGENAMLANSAANGRTGQHIATMTVENIKIFQIELFASGVLLPTCLALSKISLLLLYGRLFSVTRFRIINYALMALVFVWYMIILFMTIFLCKPIAANWDLTVEGKCLDRWALNRATPVPWVHFMGPYAFALQGFIVVMPDYAGLGVSVDGKGKPIIHEYLAAPAAAKDMEYAFKAARSAFPDVVGSQFVAIGHSQGGSVVWGFAERMHTYPVEGYLGSIPVSPVTDILKEPMPFSGVYMAGALWGVENIFPEFDMNTILTEQGQERMKADRDIGGNVGVTKVLLFAEDFYVPGWENNEFIQKFNNLVRSGGRPVAGPVMVVQGESDPMISPAVVKAATEETVKVSPGVSIQYHSYANITHVPANFAAQHTTLDWIKDRFDGKEAKAGLRVESFEPLRPADTYPADINWYIGLATEPYHTP